MTLPTSSMLDKINIRQLDAIRLPLVKKLYKQHYPSAKPKSDETIYTLEHQKQIIATLRLRTIGQYRLMTGMLVLPTYRQQGVGGALLTYCKENVFQAGDYCFALNHLGDYYQRYGFKIGAVESLPNDLRTLLLRYTGTGKDLIPMSFEKNSNGSN
ncbi:MULTISPECIES: GNAT family N-acetyltransferase [unclassified Vibrio]|uniref:GNAT family N-acetyltransferase n=1 Tax=Vibrio sp. HB236076 TaxID=3232307 RepID=A0AB39HD14_9VIBR|nr:GNAT family N-acetyltransferase [Vibrio sp. HB161653]MDP5255833.1 GNAT family N-acetyltransferase [Vibrio sp. HB161653]